MLEENKQNKKNKCPLCQVPEESLNVLKNKGQEKKPSDKKGFLRKLFKK